MKVYIVINEWRTPYESSTDYVGVYDSKAKAQVAVTETHKQDLEWIQEKGYELTDLETNNLTPDRSEIATNDLECWSYIYILEKIVL